MDKRTVSTTDPQRSQSPFDEIKRIDDTGEYWSGRALMPLLGYGSEWRNFVNAVERAKAACHNSGSSIERNFGGATEVSGQRGPARADFRVTRYGAYLVAMNGDPRKSEVAAAQSYFAIKTREAEVAAEIDLTDPLAVIERTNETLTKAIAIARSERDRADTAEADNAILAPKAAIAEQWMESQDTVYVVEWAKTFGLTERAGFDALRAMGVLFKRDGLNLPRVGFEKYFDLVDEWVPGRRKYVKVPKLYPEGQRVLGDMLVAEGYAAARDVVPKQRITSITAPVGNDRRSGGDESKRPGGRRR